MPPTSLEQLLTISQSSHKKDQCDIDFSNKKINQIGHIPQEICQHVQVLNLSHNNLRSLEGIDQFKKLQNLSLAYNKISKSEGLLILKSLLHLKRLQLKGNPFLQNPLSQEMLTLLSSYENDLQILEFAFVDENRQSVVNQHKRSKSQSRILGKSAIKKINSQDDLQKLSKSIQMNKSVQKSKASMLMSNMQEYIEEKHESQEMSSIEIDKNDTIPFQQQNSKEQISFLKPPHEGFTPIKKSPKFASFSIEQRNNYSLSQTQKFQQQSTNVKHKYISNSKIIQESIPLESRTETKQEQSGRVSWEKKGLESPQRNFKYQVNNLQINMDLGHAALDYPSITQKEDHDSYQIQFDFMSPKKIQSPSRVKISPSQQISPSYQLKGLTHSYVKIQEDEVVEQDNEEHRKEKEVYVSPIIIKKQKPKISQGTLAFLTRNMKSLSLRAERKSNSSIANKQNQYQRRFEVETPLNLARKGSLHESMRSIVPQSNVSNAQNVINKLLNQSKSHQENQSFSFNFSLGEMLQNTQKFERFYYMSLTRLKPTFSLLYSPFNSLKTEEKDLLLQELFKNHKQIFILLLKQFYSKQKLQEQLSEKNVDLQKAQQWKFQNKVLNDKVKQYEKALTFQKNRFTQMDMQNKKLKRYIDQFEDILSSRQKIIGDSKREYEKVHKALIKKEEQLKKNQNEDQIQEQITQLSETRIKNKFFKMIQKKAQWTVKLKIFIEKRENKQKLKQQAHQRQLKRIIFQSFERNLNQQKSIKEFLNGRNKNATKKWFEQWKSQTKIEKIEKQFCANRNTKAKQQFLTHLNQFYLNKKRNQKIVQFNKIRLQKKVFIKCFMQNLQLQKNKKQLQQTSGLKFLRKNLLQRSFQSIKIFNNDQFNYQQGNQSIIQKSVILKRQCHLFQKICRYLNKEQEFRLQCLQRFVTKNQGILFLKNLKKNSQVCLKLVSDEKKTMNYRLTKIFNFFKQFTIKNLKAQRKFENVTRKIVQQRRVKTLIVQFRQNNLRQKIQNQKKQKFFTRSKQLKQNNKTIEQKKSQIKRILEFKRGLRAKNELISLLRHENLRKKMNHRRLVMQQHYLIQESKYKESYELNMLTMDQLKNQIQTYLDEIQFYKLQVQKLSQRELFILQEKQNCLLEIQQKQDENLNLKKQILRNQQKLDELQRKYEKSLDMYAAAVDQINEKEKKIDSVVYYNTMIPADKGYQTTFRREVLQPSFSSLKR